MLVVEGRLDSLPICRFPQIGAPVGGSYYFGVHIKAPEFCKLQYHVEVHLRYVIL